MISNIYFKQFSRSDLKNNSDLLRKFVTIIRQEEAESDYPLPILDFEFYKKFYLQKPLPFQEQFFVLLEFESKCIAYGNIRSNSKIDKEMAFLFIYIIPEYRGNKLSWLITEKLIESIPTRIKIINIGIRTDSIAPNYENRRNQLLYFQSILGSVKFKARRSTTELEKFNTKEVLSKTETLKKEALKKGFLFKLIIDRPNFEKLPFSQREYINFLESIDNDMPKENASFEDIELTDEMFQYRYDLLKPLKRTRWHYIAIHEESNKPAGITEVLIDKKKPIVIYQGETGVFHKYRGNKLGLTLKYLMLAEILTNELTVKSKYWMTFNADSNEHMILINDELGYKEDALWFRFEIEKEKFFSIVKEKTSEKFELLDLIE